MIAWRKNNILFRSKKFWKDLFCFLTFELAKQNIGEILSEYWNISWYDGILLRKYMENIAALLARLWCVSQPSVCFQQKHWKYELPVRYKAWRSPSTGQLHFITRHQTQCDRLYNITQSSVRLFYS